MCWKNEGMTALHKKEIGRLETDLRIFFLFCAERFFVESRNLSPLYGPISFLQIVLSFFV
jgi:hypothetical protein